VTAFHGHNGITSKIESLSLHNRLELYGKVGCAITDLIEASKLVVRLRTMLTSYDRIANQITDHKELYKTSVEQITSLMDCEFGQVFLVDERKETLYTQDDQGSVLSRRWDEGIYGQVCMTRKSVRIENVASDPRYSAERDKPHFKTLIVKNLLCVPINELVSQKTYGSLD